MMVGKSVAPILILECVLVRGSPYREQAEIELGQLEVTHMGGKKEVLLSLPEHYRCNVYLLRLLKQFGLFEARKSRCLETMDRVVIQPLPEVLPITGSSGHYGVPIRLVSGCLRPWI